MIKIDFKNAVKVETFLKYQNKIKKLGHMIENYESVGSEYLGWKDIPNNNVINKQIISEIKSEVKRLVRDGVEVLVVIGIGGSSVGAKAAIKMINGNYPEKKDMEVLFVGEGMSSTELGQQIAYISNKKFAINVISKSGNTLETNVTFRVLKRLLQERVGLNTANKYIIATTNANDGPLLEQAIKYEWTRFVIPDSVGGRYSILTPVGLFPMACAGIDIKKVLESASKATKLYSLDSVISNDAYKYAVARHVLSKKFPIELMVQTESQMSEFTEWWKQLSAESEGKNGKGIFPAGAVFSKDLHSLGQYIQQGTRNLFETVITVVQPTLDIKLFKTEKDEDNLNHLSTYTIHSINNNIIESARDAHVRVGKVPNIEISIMKMDETALGYLIIFFQRAIAMTAYLNDVNPFDQPGVETYKANLRKLLK